MLPILGRRWQLRVDLGPALGLNILPHGEPNAARRNAIIQLLNRDLEDVTSCLKAGWPTRECESIRQVLFTNGFYNNGKGLQKLGTTCLLAHKLYGANDEKTKTCGSLFKNAWQCHYNPAEGCGGVPHAYYDEKWGGIASRQGFTTDMCGLADFGNACYNDHHYHYGYFIHAAAILLYVKPEMREENSFIAYVNSLIRDIANPSTADTYFPQFRAFDWYDLHSWSHGVTPSADGKDEESTSEDINAYFGIQQWARLLKFHSLEQTSTLMMALLAHTTKRLFLMKDDNDIHPPDYVRNRVTGIFFESKVHYGTFFGAESVFIHGIQMLPLTPALLLARDKEFCQQEYNDIISKTGFNTGKPGWDSLLITGNLAIIDPPRAFGMLQGLPESGMNGGLSRAWALYWTACLESTR